MPCAGPTRSDCQCRSIPIPILRSATRYFDALRRAPRGLNEGRVSSSSRTKEKSSQAGFFPCRLVMLREQELATIYRDSPLFRDLRDTSKLEGKCSSCEFKEICGGSRARAYALTGNPHAEEPCCSYIPRGYVQPAEKLKVATTLHVLQGA